MDAQDISIFGGTHAAGQIVTLTGAQGLNPTNMAVSYITTQVERERAEYPLGLFRNPLPMSDGTLVAAFTPHTYRHQLAAGTPTSAPPRCPSRNIISA